MYSFTTIGGMSVCPGRGSARSRPVSRYLPFVVVNELQMDKLVVGVGDCGWILGRSHLLWSLLCKAIAGAEWDETCKGQISNQHTAEVVPGWSNPPWLARGLLQQQQQQQQCMTQICKPEEASSVLNPLHYACTPHDIRPSELAEKWNTI